MKPLALFLYKKPTLSIEAGILLLGLVLALGYCFIKYTQLSQLQSTLQARMTQTKLSRQHQQQSAPNKTSEPAQTSLKKTEKALMFTWAPLFVALENVQTSDISLMSIEPDQIKQTLTLVALAKDKASMFGYTKRLQMEKVLNKVRISHHIVQVDIPGQPIEFGIEAEMME